jgi:hypothetical protein
MILCPVSLGELVDKITILKIKLVKIVEETKRNNVLKEYKLLSEILEQCGLSEDNDHFKELYTLNLKFWEYHDWQRERWIKVMETKTIDSELYWKNSEEHVLNDQRAEIKKKINTLYGSEIVEEKQFISYAL